MMTPILSICIPTYNRQEWLARAMESIRIPQELLDRIEIVVSDNASKDCTQAYMEALSRQVSNIRYVRLSRNMGFDYNIVHVMSQARGEYCWLFGDDDIMRPDAIQIIWGNLELRPDLLLMNRINCDAAQRPKRRQYWLDKEMPVPIDLSDEKELLEYLHHARSIGALFSFISCVVVRKSRLRLNDIPPSRMLTGYIHVYLIMRDIVRTGGKLKYEAACLVHCRWPAVTSPKVSLDHFRQDVESFCGFIDEFFYDRSHVIDSLLAVLRREHPIKKLVFLFSQNPEEQQTIARLSQRIGYPKHIVERAWRIGNCWVVHFILKRFYLDLRRLVRGV